MARLGGVAVAGAAYRGVGVPACIASGRARGAAGPVRRRRGDGPRTRRRPGRPSLPGRRRAAGPRRCRRGAGGPWASPAPGCSTGAWPGCGCVPACGRAGWPASAATPSASCGPAPSTGTAPSCSSSLEALFMAAAAGLTPPGRGRAPAFVAAFTLSEAIRMTLALRGLPLGGVFLGQARRSPAGAGPGGWAPAAHGGGVGRGRRGGHLRVRHRSGAALRGAGILVVARPGRACLGSPGARRGPAGARPSGSPWSRAAAGGVSTRSRCHRPASSRRSWRPPSSVEPRARPDPAPGALARGRRGPVGPAAPVPPRTPR